MNREDSAVTTTPMPLRLRFWLAAAALAIVSGCGSATVPEDFFYRLNIEVPAPAISEPVVSGTVEVDRFLADGLLTNRPIAFTSRGQESQLQTYHYHFWTEPPAIMLQNALAAYARTRKFARAVVTPEMRVDADFVISGKLRRMEQITDGTGAVVVEMEIALRDLRSAKLIHIGTYRAEIETPNQTVRAAVDTITDAVTEIFDKFLDEAAAAHKS